MRLIQVMLNPLRDWQTHAQVNPCQSLDRPKRVRTRAIRIGR
jgi:hypothetical protein